MFAEVVAALLIDGAIEPVYYIPASVFVDPEPIVVSEGELTPISDIPLGRRLSVVCTVTVCREMLVDCEWDVGRCFECLNSCDWSTHADIDDGYSLCGLEVSEPQRKGRDKSGRWLYTLEVTLTVERTSDGT